MTPELEKAGSAVPVFIHVPRTGGNSILPHLAGKDVIIVHHAKKDDLSQYLNNWVFSFMREPCDRTISAYAYLRDGGTSSEDLQDGEQYVRPFVDFNDFVLHGLEKAAAHQRHFRPQHFWLADENEKARISFLGRTDQIQDDFNEVCNICGWDKVELGVLNSSRRHGLECTQAAREVIQTVYAEDYRLLRDHDVVDREK